MVAPSFLVETIVKVLVHILLAIVIPRFSVHVEVVFVDFGDGKFLKSLVAGSWNDCCETISSGSLGR